MKIKKIILMMCIIGGLTLTACDKNKNKTEDKTKVAQDSTKKDTVVEEEVSENDTLPANISATPILDNIEIGKEKIGYLNSAELLSSVPEARIIEKKLEELYKGKEAELQGLSKTAQTKLQTYQENGHLLNETERKSREEELMSLDQQLQKMQYDASNVMDKKRQEMLAPVLKKLDKAVKQVAKENGYTFVLDPSIGGIVYADTTRDLLPLVKKKLGLKK